MEATWLMKSKAVAGRIPTQGRALKRELALSINLIPLMHVLSLLLFQLDGLQAVAADPNLCIICQLRQLASGTWAAMADSCPALPAVVLSLHEGELFLTNEAGCNIWINPNWTLCFLEGRGPVLIILINDPWFVQFLSFFWISLILYILEKAFGIYCDFDFKLFHFGHIVLQKEYKTAFHDILLQ